MRVPLEIETFINGQSATTRMEDEMMKTPLAKTLHIHYEEQLRPRRFRYMPYALCGALAFSMVLGGFASRASATNLVSDGLEFQVNTYTNSYQENPRASSNVSGDTMVVWGSHGQDGDIKGVFGQRYDALGNPMGPEFQVNTTTSGYQIYPDVALDASGNALFVWQTENVDGDMGAIAGQRYDVLGNPVGPEFQVNTYTNGDQRTPVVAMNSSGSSLVVWTSDGQDGSGSGIFGQRFDALGNPHGPEFQVNTFTNDNQDTPAVAMNSGGSSLVVWTSTDQDGDDDGIFGQHYDALGNPHGPEFQVNTFTNAMQSSPDVAMADMGNSLVVWNSLGQDGSSFGIFGQRYNALGNPVGGEFQVNTATNLDQVSSEVAMDSVGNSLVVWRSSHNEGFDIFSQQYDFSGNSVGLEFQASTWSGSQHSPAVAMHDTGALVVWNSLEQDGSGGGVFGQRYIGNDSPVCDLSQAQPAALWSNDHAFNLINIDNVSDPDGDAVTITVNEIYQDERVNARGSGGTGPDGKGVGTNAAEVRAEYILGGNGRQYRINFTADDHRGGSCSGMTFVRVMKSKFDWDWIIYDSTVSPYVEIPTQRIEVR